MPITPFNPNSAPASGAVNPVLTEIENIERQNKTKQRGGNYSAAEHILVLPLMRFSPTTTNGQLADMKQALIDKAEELAIEFDWDKQLVVSPDDAAYGKIPCLSVYSMMRLE